MKKKVLYITFLGLLWSFIGCSLSNELTNENNIRNNPRIESHNKLENENTLSLSNKIQSLQLDLTNEIKYLEKEIQRELNEKKGSSQSQPTNLNSLKKKKLSYQELLNALKRAENQLKRN